MGEEQGRRGAHLRLRLRLRLRSFLIMTGTGILLRRAQSGLRRARKWAAVTGTTMEEDWTQLAEVCPLPTFRTLPSEQLKYNQKKKSSSKSLHLEERKRKDDPAAS